MRGIAAITGVHVRGKNMQRVVGHCGTPSRSLLQQGMQRTQRLMLS